jgi:hypothetical protein
MNLLVFQFVSDAQMQNATGAFLLASTIWVVELSL